MSEVPEIGSTMILQKPAVIQMSLKVLVQMIQATQMMSY